MLVPELELLETTDEDRVPRLVDWEIPAGRNVAQGYVYDHPRFPDGSRVTTSRIQRDGSPLFLETLNTFYILGERR